MIFELWLHVISADASNTQVTTSFLSCHDYSQQESSRHAAECSLISSRTNRCHNKHQLFPYTSVTAALWVRLPVNCNLAELSPTNHLRTHSERSLQSGHFAVIALVIFSFILNTWIYFCNYSVLFILNMYSSQCLLEAPRSSETSKTTFKSQKKRIFIH
jgi:hypothetical protein